MTFDPARVKWLVQEAAELPSPAERAAYLDRKCGGEPGLRARVEELLAAKAGAATLSAAPETIAESRAAKGLDSLATVAPSGDGRTNRTVVPETLAGSRGGEPLDSLATVAPSGDGGKFPTIAGAPPVAPGGRFVPGQVIAGRYTLLEILGEGGMGTVYRAEQSTPVKRPVALKLIKGGMDSRNVLARFDAERQALAMMDHPNIARVFDAGATDSPSGPTSSWNWSTACRSSRTPTPSGCRMPVAARLRN